MRNRPNKPLLVIAGVIVLAAVFAALYFMVIRSGIKDKITLDGLDNSEKNIYLSTDERYSELAEKVKSAVTAKEFPGSLLIATDEQIIFASGTDRLQKDGETVSPYTTYQIGSVTKTYTATCILRLIQDGKISLDDQMSKYFPNCEPIKKITVYNLLHMDSGIPDLVNYPDQSFVHRNDEFMGELAAGTLSSEKIVDYLCDAKPVFEPGARVEYSNTNFILLALIIEQVTGKTYHEYLNELIISPLGLEHTESGNITGATCSYSYPDLPYKFEDNLPLFKGAGDITSNVLDILRFDRALFNGELIDSEQLDTMFDFKGDYSCGWMKDSPKSALHQIGNYWKASDADTVFHGGRTPGFISYNIVTEINGERAYVIILFNDNENTAASGKEIYTRMGKVLELF